MTTIATPDWPASLVALVERRPDLAGVGLAPLALEVWVG